MSSKVTFDYSKATSFVSENEVDLMKRSQWMQKKH